MTADARWFDGLTRQLASEVPEQIEIEFGGPEVADPLLDQEAALATEWTELRRMQFHIGRSAARRAMRRRFGLTAPVPIPFDDEGVPVWPSTVVGSLSHKQTHCVAVVSDNAAFVSLGVDLETDVRSRREKDLLRRVCSPTERTTARSLQNQFNSPASVFVATKEAFYKMQFPLTHKVLEWNDVEVSVAPPKFTARHRRMRGQGLLVRGDGWILAFCWMQAA